MNDKNVRGLPCLKSKLLAVSNRLSAKILKKTNTDKRHNRSILDCAPTVGRTTARRDKQPVVSAVLGRTTARRDERRYLAGARRRSLVMNDELLVMKTTCTFFSSSFCFSRHSSFSPTGSRLPQKGASNRGAMLRAHEGLLKQTRLHKLLASNLLSKVVQLLSFYYPKLWRPVVSCRTVFPSRPCRGIFGKSIYLKLGRTTEFRDEHPFDSAVLGRTTASRDERRYLACAGRRASLVMGDELSVMSPLVPCGQRYLASYRFLRSAKACSIPRVEMTWGNEGVWRNTGEIWRDALTERPNASAGRRNAKKIRRNAKKFRRNASLCFPFSTALFCPFRYLLGRTAENRDEQPTKGSSLRALKPYAFYLITLKILFCVCLAHARQSSAPEAAHGVALQSEYFVTGRVLASGSEELLTGATVRIKGSTTSVLTDAKGLFRISVKEPVGVLIVGFLGYKTQEIDFRRGEAEGLTIILEPNANQLDEVEVSTGYQTLPKERATGSFVQVDNELFNRSVSTDVISRLKGITPSLAFDERGGGEPHLSVRGRSTIFANDQPLIVLDNFPYEGDINSINPNDIENVSILRDAAAASIWGVRAANGVIVITTKKGSGEIPISIGFNTNLTVGNKPNLYYQPRMSSGDFIEVERMLFDNGYFNNDINNVTSYPPISPVIELLSAARNGTVDATESEAAIQQLKQYDIRDDLNRYFYRRSVKQQYALNFRGGGKSYNYYYSAGFDQNKDNLIGNGLRRISLSTRQNLQPVQDLELSFGLDYTLSNNAANSALGTITLGSRNIYPYARLSGDKGEALPISNKYRADFIQESSSLGLLDWTYRPLDERMYTERTSEANNMRFQTGIRYRIWMGLNAEVRYQYQQQRGAGENLYYQDAFYTRDLINRYTTFENGALTRNIPEGSILNTTNNKLDAHNGRMQLNYSHTQKDHDLAAIAGFEVREIKTGGNTFGFYGYDEANGSSRPVNYNTYYRLYPSGYALIPDPRNISGTIDRFRSYYSNVSYSYKSRYTLSASGRIDQSNLFGVAANLKAVPLWSIGGKWVLSDEPFYKWAGLPALALKATYGYNGNLDNSVTAFTTARMANASFTGKPAAFIISPPNPNLKWERVSMLNLGVEFASKNDRISGSFEYFKKHASDLIGEGPLGATTGLTSFRGNVADMVGKGFDLMLSTDNIRKKLIWRSTLLFSYAIDEITDYKLTASSLSAYFPDNSINRESLFYTPVEGRPLFSIYSYKWAGLDGANGNPLGYLNGMPSDNYTAISSMNNTPVDSLIYHGRAMAPFFGSLRNDFIYKQWSLSVNISYSFGHYFRKPTISYGDLYRTYSSLHADFNKRWQKPGDELFTTVPSMVFPDINGRDAFYVNSEVNVKRADLVRLQDIRLAYNFAFKQHNGLMKALQVYAFANNIGLLWTANGEGIDPDFPTMPLPFTLSFGAQLTL